MLVADEKNLRVPIFDSDLQLNRILRSTKEGAEEEFKIKWPEKLCYDEEQKQLIVGGTEEVKYLTEKELNFHQLLHLRF